MLNYIWAGMILLGVIYGVCTGQMSALTGGALDSAREAVSLCITMAGVMALWMGLMEIAQESGMIAKMTKGIRPFLKFMFPSLCTLLDKPERRVIDVHVDYTGFNIPDEFVVGYGLDYDQRYRNLPYIGVVEFD